MRKPILSAILLLILASVACGTYITPTSTPPLLPTIENTPALDTQAPQDKKTAVPPSPTLPPSTITITGNVWKRDQNGIAHGSLQAGQVVPAWCDGDVCYLQGDDIGLTIWRGCTDQANGQKCKSK